MASQNNILVVGATGKQGGSVINALLSLPPQQNPIHIFALTRDATSPRAQALASSHPETISLVQGDSTNPSPIFASHPKGTITSLFLVTTPGKTSEEDQAIPLIDAAVSHGVQHIVFSSVDRGGDAKSWTNPTSIPHFKSKHNIELYLRDKAQKQDDATKFTWTILRPTAFMDNTNPGFFCSMFTAMWDRALSPQTKLQLISVRDIGIFAAKALTNFAEWAGRAVGLAGDSLTLDELRQKFKSVTGKEIPQTFGFLGGALLWAVKDVGLMFEFFEKEGYGADIEALRGDVPELLDFEAWLTGFSQWKDEK